MYTIFDTSLDIEHSGVDTAVLPMGSVEPKGPHLPVGFDLLLANRFSKELCRGKAVYLLPVFPFSTAMETRGFRGTVALRQQTLWNVLEDIAAILARHGFKRLAILDFSNYNWILKHAVRELNLNRELIQAVWVNPKAFAIEDAEADLGPDFGGGAVETSLAMALFEGLVRKPVEDYDAGLPRERIDYDGLVAVAPDGYWGRPSLATAENGHRFYRLMLDRTMAHLNYAFELFPSGHPLEDNDVEGPWWPGEDIPGAVEHGVDWHSTLVDVKAAGTDLAVMATSAIEQHSPALPLATDYLIALEISRHLAGELGAYLLPALPIVTSWGHVHFRGSLTLSAMTVRRLIDDMVESLYSGGFRKVVLVNTHGGNWVVKPTMIEINQRYADLKMVSTGDILAYRGQAPVEQLHACEMEASFIKPFIRKDINRIGWSIFLRIARPQPLIWSEFAVSALMVSGDFLPGQLSKKGTGIYRQLSRKRPRMSGKFLQRNK